MRCRIPDTGCPVREFEFVKENIEDPIFKTEVPREKWVCGIRIFIDSLKSTQAQNIKSRRDDVRLAWHGSARNKMTQKNVKCRRYGQH